MALTKRGKRGKRWTLKDKRDSKSWYFDPSDRFLSALKPWKRRSSVDRGASWNTRFAHAFLVAGAMRVIAIQHGPWARASTERVPIVGNQCGGRGRKSEWNKEEKKKRRTRLTRDWSKPVPRSRLPLCMRRAAFFLPFSSSAPMCITRCLRYLLFSISIPSRAPFNSRQPIRRDHRYRFYHVHSCPSCLYSAFDFFSLLLSFFFGKSREPSRNLISRIYLNNRCLPVNYAVRRNLLVASTCANNTIPALLSLL